MRSARHLDPSRALDSLCARISAESGSPPRIKSGQAIFRKTLKRPADQGYASSSRLIAAISESVGRPRLIAEALNFVGGRRLREAKMLLPSLRRIGEIGVDVGAMKDVAGSTGIEDSIRRSGKRMKGP